MRFGFLLCGSVFGYAAAQYAVEGTRWTVPVLIATAAVWIALWVVQETARSR